MQPFLLRGMPKSMNTLNLKCVEDKNVVEEMQVVELPSLDFRNFDNQLNQISLDLQRLEKSIAIDVYGIDDDLIKADSNEDFKSFDIEVDDPIIEDYIDDEKDEVKDFAPKTGMLPVKIVTYDNDVNKDSFTGMCVINNRKGMYTNTSYFSESVVDNLFGDIETDEGSKQVVTGRKLLSVPEEDSIQSILEDIDELMEEMSLDNGEKLEADKFDQVVPGRKLLSVPEEESLQAILEDIDELMEEMSLDNGEKFEADKSDQFVPGRKLSSVPEEDSLHSILQDIDELVEEIKSHEDESSKASLADEFGEDEEDAFVETVEEEDGNKSKYVSDFVKTATEMPLDKKYKIEDESSYEENAETFNTDPHKSNAVEDPDDVEQEADGYSDAHPIKFIDVEQELETLEDFLSQTHTIDIKMEFIIGFLRELAQKEINEENVKYDLFEEMLLGIHEILDEAGIFAVASYPSEDMETINLFAAVVSKIYPRYESLTYFTQQIVSHIAEFSKHSDNFDDNFSLVIGLTNNLIFNHHYATLISDVIRQNDDETEVYLAQDCFDTLTANKPFMDQVFIFKEGWEQHIQQRESEDYLEGITVDYLEPDDHSSPIEEEEENLNSKNVEESKKEDDYKMEFSVGSIMSNSCPDDNPDCEEIRAKSEACDKNDLSCQEKELNRYKEDENVNAATYAKESLPRKITKKEEAENTASNSKKFNKQKLKDEDEPSKTSSLIRKCQNVLEKLIKHSAELDTTSPKKKRKNKRDEDVQMIRNKVKRGLKTKKLINEYSKIHQKIQNSAEVSDR